MSDFIIVSFYTKNTGYEKEFKERLLPSLLRWNLPFDVQGIRSRGCWEKNAIHKPAFIRKMMDKHPEKNIVWLDVDAAIHKHPKLFGKIDADIAVHYIDWSIYSKYINERELDSAVIFFKNNQAARGVIDDWTAHLRTHGPIRHGDQMTLQVVLDSHRRNGTVVVQELPPEYCKIFDSMKQVENPVIEQFQASRRFKTEVESWSFKLGKTLKSKVKDSWLRMRAINAKSIPIVFRYIFLKLKRGRSPK